MFIWYLFSILWSIKIEYTVEYLFYLICGLSIIITLIYYMKTIKIQNIVFKILAIIFIVEIILSLLEAFTPFRLPISPFSKYVTYFGREMKIGNDLDDTAIREILQMPTGFQWNPNNLAITFLILTPFFLLHSNKWFKYLGVFSILVLIIKSSSRGAFLAFLFMIFLYFVSLNKKRFFIFLFILIFIIPILSLFSVNLEFLKNSKNHNIRDIAYSFDALKMYLSFEDLSETDSIGIRKTLIYNGIEALKESNYIGVGGGCSTAVQENLGGVAGRIASMHNFWIEMLVDSGVIFTFLFIIWYIYITLKLYIIGISTKDKIFKYYSQSLFLSMSAFSIGCVSASSVIYLFPMWLMFGFAIATINNYKRYKYENTFIK
jgi:teichuronic acid biosynthesis protein TuaE